MVDEATRRGANAILAMRFDANEVAQGYQEVVAYGTAVKVTQRDARQLISARRAPARGADDAGEPTRSRRSSSAPRTRLPGTTTNSSLPPGHREVGAERVGDP